MLYVILVLMSVIIVLPMVPFVFGEGKDERRIE